MQLLANSKRFEVEMTEPLFFTDELDVNYGINTRNQSEQKIKPISKKVFTIGFQAAAFNYETGTYIIYVSPYHNTGIMVDFSSF